VDESGSLLTEILGSLSGLPPAELSKLQAEVDSVVGDLKFIPSLGPQTDAYNSKADILLFGGEPGGGKTGLLIGLALNDHDRSLLVRKQFADAESIIDNAKEMVGSSEDFVGGGRPKYNKPNGGVIHFQGMAGGDDLDTGKQGTPYDFIGVDEGAQLPKNQILMLFGWNRTKKREQRCRMVIATNPPVDSVGDWLSVFFGPWLNPDHPRPEKQGELRWFIMNAADESEEVDGPDPLEIDGETYYPHSRTYIHSKLENNPFLNAADYRKRLQVIPEPYRSMLTSGNFMLARKDQDFQLIPSAWILAAQARWTPKPPEGLAMTCMAYDPAGGGRDNAPLAMRYGGWYAPLVVTQGEETEDGSASAATIVRYRRDSCGVVVDCDGGWGGAVCLRLEDNHIMPLKFRGSEGSNGRTEDGTGFANKRSEAWWRFRVALDPDQEGGSTVALPPDTELRADLTAITWKLGAKGIQVEPKVIIGDGGKIVGGLRKKLGRSPGRGDAVVMAMAPGDQAVMRAKYKTGNGGLKAVVGYQNRRRY
jgi:hypothetical protein